MKKILYGFFAIVPATIITFIPCKVQAAIHTIQVANYQFTPSSLNVSVGDTVRWTWSNGSHTTTSLSVPTGAATWDANINSSFTSFDYVVTVAGNYTYQCSFHGPNMAGSFTATSASGINEITRPSLNASFFPNPVHQNLSVLFNCPMATTGTLKIYDLLGNEVKNQQNDVIAGENTWLIYTADLDNGVYIVEAFVAGRAIGIKRIVHN